ncbi:MAG: CHC2 zinc finger domain-containing protein [Planctomycetota bacterium]
MRLSEHLCLELAYGVHVGHRPGGPPPLGPDDPVPGCACVGCVTLAAGGDAEAVGLARRLVYDLSRILPAVRRGVAADVVGIWRAAGVKLPRAGVLALLAERVPGARRSGRRSQRRRDPLPVETARRVPILDVCERLGLALRKVGRSWRGPCPLHGGEGPNFAVLRERGTFRCFVCDAGGDGLALWMGVRGVDFAEAVLELAA